jgi:uncharacterized membrane protein YbhN (UPF0104 family)
MQVSKLYASSKNYSLTHWVLFVKFLLSGVVFGYIAYTVYTSNLQWNSLLFVAHSALPGFMLVALLLVPANWALEALKWKYLCRNIEPISFKRAIASVLSGVGIGLFVPQLAADASGRMLYLKSASRLASSGAMLSGHFAQFIVTILAGSASVLYLISSQHVAVGLGWATGIIAINVLLCALLFAGPRVLRMLQYVPWLSKYLVATSIQPASTKELAVAGLLSIARYSVFMLQFVALLFLVDVSLPVPVMCMGIAFVFMAKTLLPVLNFVSDLGVREASALFFFGLFHVSPEKIIMASMALWSINILLPALTGLLVLWRWKLIS